MARIYGKTMEIPFLFFFCESVGLTSLKNQLFLMLGLPSFCEAVPSIAHDSLMVNESLGFLGSWSQKAQKISDPTSWWIILMSENGLYYVMLQILKINSFPYGENYGKLMRFILEVPQFQTNTHDLNCIPTPSSKLDSGASTQATLDPHFSV